MPDCRPMVLMVCATCRENASEGFGCDEPACAFYKWCSQQPTVSARSREEMVEAVARHNCNDGAHRIRWDAASELVRERWRLEATQILSAAIPGLLED